MSLTLRTPVAKMNDMQREWFASAMIAMILADGNVAQGEAEGLMQAISFVKNPQAAERLKKFVHFNAPPTLTPFHGWEREPKSRAMILVDLMSVAIADRDFSQKEREQFHRIGALLGFTDEKVNELIHLGDTFIERMEHENVG
jgi:uncharacterized tellurite resistance protein B-like protein